MCPLPSGCRREVREMIPVDQTEFGARGDCFRACVASILELASADVPHFCEPGVTSWWHFFLDWATNRGYVVETGGPFHGEHWYTYEGSRFEWSAYPWDERPPVGYSILTGTSPRHVVTNGQHAVVALDGVMVHDPRVGDRRGVLDVYDYIVIRRPR